MQDWIEKETASAKFGTTKAKTREDKPIATKARKSKAVNLRLKIRFQKLLDTMSSKPSLKFPAGCNGKAETAAAYRFLDNEHITLESILTPHYEASIERIRQQPVVLIPQDTTELDLTRPREVMDGTGPLNDAARVGLYDHVSLALTPQRLPLGAVDAKVWARDPVEFDKPADQKRAERRARPIEEKESVRWVDGYHAACQIAEAAPEAHIVSLADSEGDIFEYLMEARPVEGARKASLIIRACQDRALVAPQEAESSGSAHHLRDQVAGTPVLSQRTLEIRGREPKSKDDRKRKQSRQPRTAEVEVRATRVTLRGPARPGGKLPDLEVNVVLVSEPSPPTGAEPIEWVLLTDLPIDSVDAVFLIIDYYMCRWQIEIYFRILKSGCKVEESQLERAERFEPYLALCMIVSWRIMYVLMLGRECPELPCDVAFDDDEWRSVYAAVKQEPPPAEPPSMKTMVGLIASLGGWLGRKCDGEPGPKAMWVGLQRMTDLALGWRARADHSGEARDNRPGSVRRRK